MPNYTIPPWLGQPANPAAQYATGLQIGARIGEAKASQAYQQQQLARQMQEAAYDQQYKNALLQMKVQDAMQKQKGIAAYQSLIGSGMNPEDALMQIGPMLGENVTDMLRVAALKEERAAALEESKRWHDEQMAKAEADRALKSQTAEAMQIEREAARKSREDIASQNRSLRIQAAVAKDEELKNLANDLSASRLNLQSARDKVGKWFGAPSATELKELERSVSEAEQAIKTRRDQLIQEYGGATTQPEDTTAQEETDTEQASPDFMEIGGFKVRRK